MISLCKSEEDVKNILDYIGDDFKSVPYLYVDTVKYGAGASNVRTWMDYDANGEIRGVYLLYYDCLHFFTRDSDRYPLETLLNAVEFLNPKVIMTREDIAKRVEYILRSQYTPEKIRIMDFQRVKPEDSQSVCETASLDDIQKMIDLMMAENIYASVYDREILEKQMMERYNDHFSHYFVLKDGENLVAAYTTFAEVPRMILFGSLIVNPSYRGKGYAGMIIKYACHFLAEKDIVKLTSIEANNAASLRAHEKIGAFPIQTLYKFVKA